MPQQPAKQSLSAVRRRSKSGSEARGGSFNAMSLTRSLSFGRKKASVRPCNNPGDDEVNLFLSDMITKDYCLEKLAEVKDDTKVVKMEIEDLLVSKHSSLVPFIKGLVVRGQREWEWIKFTDTADGDVFKVWQEKKHNICKGFANTVEDKSAYEGVITFECVIRLSRGTSSSGVKKILEAIQQDDSVARWTFEGSLYNFDADLKPAMLQKLVNPYSGSLMEEIVVSIKCGWSAELSQESKSLLNKCIEALKKLEEDEAEQQQESSKVPIRRARTSNASLSPIRRPQLPRKKSVRRCISQDNCEATQGRMRRANSMPIRRRRGSRSPQKQREQEAAKVTVARRPRRATSPSRHRSRRATSPKQRNEQEPQEQRRSRISERSSINSLASTVSSLSFSSCKEDTLASGSAHSRRGPPRRLRSFHNTATARQEADIATAAGEQVPNLPMAPQFRASVPAAPARRGAPRRTKSCASAEAASSQYNWTSFPEKTTDFDIDPDFDWETGAYINPFTSKAA